MPETTPEPDPVLTSVVTVGGDADAEVPGASPIASVAASPPAWQGFDPLPILAAKNRDKKEDDEDEENKDD